MRVVHVLSNDCPGGLNHAAIRLHEELLRQGASSWVCVQGPCMHPGLAERRPPSMVSHHGGRTTIRPRLDSVPAWLLSGKPYLSLSWLPTTLHRTVAALEPDVIHIHQPHGATVSVPQLGRFRRPIVATLHDMWLFTGGCTFDGGCGRWSRACGRCPKVQFPHAWDASRLGHRLKRRAYASTALAFVAPSRWIHDAARASSLLRDAPIEHIPYGIDLEAFSPREAAESRHALGLPDDAILVGFVAHDVDDPRKGMDLTARTIAMLRERVRGQRFVAVGIGGATPARGLFADDALVFLGRLSPQELARAYPAFDAVLVTSRQDNLPNVAIEALACGTPVFGFNVGGLGEIVARPEECLAPPFDVAALVGLLASGVADDATRRRYRDAARRRACGSFDIRSMAARHLRLYDRLADDPKAN